MPHRSVAALTNLAADSSRKGQFWVLTFGATGVVYGDIGTSPIYAFREAAVAATGSGVVTADTVLGILSLIVWSLFLIVTLKYVFVLLRADFNGEGGTFALMALGTVGGAAQQDPDPASWHRWRVLPLWRRRYHSGTIRHISHRGPEAHHSRFR